ncbi:hypothetical protein MNBD_ALPHA12-995 [hydrothermal vent metagenome]|uniref:Uncharacterized protein n=1 Tax=hydrothermal vent metagenome TaxID=652676 RepID=A0A3B0TCQ2_9ZZZZ
MSFILSLSKDELRTMKVCARQSSFIFYLPCPSWFDKLTMKDQDEARYLISRTQFVMLGQPFGVRTNPPSIHL